MRNILSLSIIFSLLLHAYGEENAKWNINPTKDEITPFAVYIPKDIDDAFKELEKMLSMELIEEMRSGTEEDMLQYHFGLGRWIRNNWALWKGEFH